MPKCCRVTFDPAPTLSSREPHCSFPAQVILYCRMVPIPGGEDPMPALVIRASRLMRRISEQSLWLYSLEMALIGWVMRIPFIALGLLVAVAAGHVPPSPATQNYNVFEALIVTPFIETTVGQLIPIETTALFTRNALAQVAVSSLFFAGLHGLADGGVFGLVAALSPCVAMAIAYVAWRKQGLWPAYWAATLVHAWTNALPWFFRVILH